MYEDYFPTNAKKEQKNRHVFSTTQEKSQASSFTVSPPGVTKSASFSSEFLVNAQKLSLKLV